MHKPFSNNTSMQSAPHSPAAVAPRPAPPPAYPAAAKPMRAFNSACLRNLSASSSASARALRCAMTSGTEGSGTGAAAGTPEVRPPHTASGAAAGGGMEGAAAAASSSQGTQTLADAAASLPPASSLAPAAADGSPVFCDADGAAAAAAAACFAFHASSRLRFSSAAASTPPCAVDAAREQMRRGDETQGAGPSPMIDDVGSTYCSNKAQGLSVTTRQM